MKVSVIHDFKSDFSSTHEIRSSVDGRHTSFSENIYDDDCNGQGLVWLDYRHPASLRQNQVDWVAGLNDDGVIICNLNSGVTINWSGAWRLPSAGDSPVSGCGESDSEMGHLYSIELGNGRFEKDICRARTFGFLQEVEYLKRNGFARGGSLENAVVMDEKGVLNPEGLRWENEFIRHKILDCIGDLSLLGMPILGHIIAHKSGHALNHSLLKRFMDRKSCWETVTL